MAIVNVFDASDVVLDYLVAKCEGISDITFYSGCDGGDRNRPRKWVSNSHGFTFNFSSWAQGGPIIDREKIETVWVILDANGKGYWKSQNLFTDTYGYMGKTALVAAMRCYVASKLGGKAEVPDELIS